MRGRDKRRTTFSASLTGFVAQRTNPCRLGVERDGLCGPFAPNEAESGS